jgi:hypothetical protein
MTKQRSYCFGLPVLILWLCVIMDSSPVRAGTTNQVLEPVDQVARDTMAGCLEVLKEQKAAETFENGLCIGVIKGLHYLSADVCVPPALSLVEIANVVARFPKAHPDSVKQDFREIVLQALRSAWPCAGQRGT